MGVYLEDDLKDPFQPLLDSIPVPEDKVFLSHLRKCCKTYVLVRDT